MPFLGLLLAAQLAAAAPPTLAAADSDIAARYRGGVVERPDLESYREYLASAPRRRWGGALGRDLTDVERWVLSDVLAGGLDPSTLSPRERAALRIERDLLAEAGLRTRVQAASEPTDEAVRGYFEARRADFARPRRWQLSQIFKRIPADASPEDRASIRRELEEIRERIVAGEALDLLATELSDSPSRDLGGRAGVAALVDLRPELAAVVGQLGAGELQAQYLLGLHALTGIGGDASSGLDG
ncbi:MAG: peptidylprolyl isomerase, partial [Acidobacteriota bacterium]